MSQTRISNLPAVSLGNLNPEFAFPVEVTTGAGPTLKLTLAQIGDYIEKVRMGSSFDFSASINGRLQVKDPVDQLITDNVDLSNPFGEEGKRFALAGQLDKTLNGIYKCEGGSLTFLYPTGYFDTYGPGSLFLDKATGKLWFIPVSKKNSNVVDPVTGIRPNEAFDFMELPRAVLSIDVLDRWEMHVLTDLGENDGLTQVHQFSLPRVFPTEFFEFIVAAYGFINHNNESPVMDGESRILFGLLNGNIQSNPSVNLTGRRFGIHFSISDAFLLDQIETRLTPLPGNDYYYSTYVPEPSIEFQVPNPSILDELTSEFTILTQVNNFPAGTLFSWTQISGPNTATMTDGGIDEHLNISDLIAGTYVFEVAVSDGAGTTLTNQFTLNKL